jgi:drug/metabolite transporter (DMT)-like permease
MLRSNIKVIGIFYCILCGFSYAIQSLVLEQVIRYLVTSNGEIKNDVTYGIYILVA